MMQNIRWISFITRPFMPLLIPTMGKVSGRHTRSAGMGASSSQRRLLSVMARRLRGSKMIKVTINDAEHSLDVPEDTPILWVLRDTLKLTGTRFSCGMALCGACTVHVDGNPVRSCSTPISSVAGKHITTIEAMSADPVGQKVQQAWMDEAVAQCGYCQSGQVMSAVALLKQHPNPTDEQIDSLMSGNICRCGTYPRIRSAIHRAASNQTADIDSSLFTEVKA